MSLSATVEAAAITVAVTDVLNAQNKKNTPPDVNAVQVVDPKSGVTTICGPKSQSNP